MKIQIVEKCRDCKFYQFDPDYLEPIYYGKDCCMFWYWHEPNGSQAYPRIIENANSIPEWCQLENCHTVNGIPVDELDKHKINIL